MINAESLPVSVTVPVIKYPFPLLQHISLERPEPSVFKAKCGQVTSVASLHQCVEKLDAQMDSLGKIVHFVGAQLREKVDVLSRNVQAKFDLNKSVLDQARTGFVANRTATSHDSRPPRVSVLNRQS